MNVSIHFQRQNCNVVRLRRVAGKRANFLEQPFGDSARSLCAQCARISEQPLVAIAFLLWVECFVDAVRVKNKRIALMQCQFSPLEFYAWLKPERCAEVLDGPTRRFAEP